MSTTSIDDVLATAHLPIELRKSVIQAPEEAREPIDIDNSPETSEIEDLKPEKLETKPEIEQKHVEVAPKSDQKPESAKESGFDEYGNEKPKSLSKTYSEEEVNERINQAVRERLARLEKNNPQLQQQQPPVQQPNQTQEDWQQELEKFVIQTTEKQQQQRLQQERQYKEQQAEQEFVQKFHSGMAKFSDFNAVVANLPVTDAMTMATRGMKDPAAFIYAAAKRQPAELQRISQIDDPYVQIAEMGRLEERLRKTQSVTKAARPISPHREDVTTQEPTKKPVSIEELMQASDKIRLSRMAGRKRR